MVLPLNRGAVGQVNYISIKLFLKFCRLDSVVPRDGWVAARSGVFICPPVRKWGSAQERAPRPLSSLSSRTLDDQASCEEPMTPGAEISYKQSTGRN